MAWGLLSIAALVWALHVFFRDVVPPFPRASQGDSPIFAETKIGTVPFADAKIGTVSTRQKDEGVFLSLSLAGSIVGIWSGQSNALMLAMILLGLAAIVRRHWWQAAWWLAAPVFIKLWPAALASILALFWPRRLAGRLAAACAAMALLPFLTRPPGTVLWQYHQWYLALTGPFQGRWSGYRDAWTIWEQAASWLRVGADAAPYREAYTAAQLLTAAAVLVWCLRQRRREPSNSRLLMAVFSMWAAWQLLFGPATEQLTYGLTAPAAAWAVTTSFAEKRGRVWTLAAWGLTAMMPSGDIEQTVVRALPGGMAILPLGVAMLAGWLVWHESDRGSPQPPSRGIGAA
jgi:hypothetical protein